MTSTSKNQLRQELLQIYDDLAHDIAQAAPVCEVSGRCCRFEEYGHRLYISGTEAELLLEAGLPEGASLDESGCPFQQGKICNARERRPFGCRVYFCDPKYAGQAEALSEKYLDRLKHAHQKLGEVWDYGPLHEFLQAYAEAQGEADESPG